MTIRRHRTARAFASGLVAGVMAMAPIPVSAQPAPTAPPAETDAPGGGDPTAADEAPDADAPTGEGGGDGPERAETAATAKAATPQIPEVGECRREGVPAAAPSAAPALSAAEELEMQRARQDYDKALVRFVAAAEDFQKEVDVLLERSFGDRIAGVNRRFDKESDEVEVSERQRRLDAIARFERFIQKYPSDAVHTPDAMFRLAELYYERSQVDYVDAQERYGKEMDLYKRGKIPSEPKSPIRDYSDSVKLYRTMLARFGDVYRYSDAVYYLLGYVLQESGDDLESRKAWMTMVEKHPQSDHAPEVFLRVGESHFDYGEFAEAAQMYQKALAYTESRFYDKALYKLAWTYFQMYDYDRAIRSFKQLIAYYDANRAAGSATASALRDEAIDYLAKSLAEDDWDNDGVDDAEHGVQRALAYLSEGQPWENDIVARYADSLYELHDKEKYAEAVAVYRELIKRDPTALDAVKYQQQIIRIFDILRDIDSATVERQQLATMFAPGSVWANANREHLKRVQDATQAVESAMRRRALFLHQRAQELKAQAAIEERPELLVEAFDHYRKAAKAYEEYLAKYPNEPASYEMRFYLAETMYYSDQHRPAAIAYFEVASDPHQDKFREPAAWSAVKAYERILKDTVDKGYLPPKADPNREYDFGEGAEDEEASDVRAVTAETFPAEVKDWMSSIDFYVGRDIQRDGSRKPQVAFAYQAGDLALRYNHLAEARRRFQQVIACFPDDPLAASAMAQILNSYKEENDLANLEKWANIAERASLGDPEMTKSIRSRIRVFKLGAQFQRAEALLAAARHLEAAREFERIADQNPDVKFLDKAYYNAAMAYKEVKYYDSASRIFEKLVTDPRFANSEFKDESLFELAENFKLFFNFDKAVTTYLTWFERTDGKEEANRPYALFSAGQLQEYSGEQAQAAATYERYARTFGDRPDAANALFRAADIYGDMKQRDDQKRVLRQFVDRFKDTPGMGPRVVQAMLRLGRTAETERKWRDATKQYKDVIREYEVRGYEPGSDAAWAAAEASFRLVEQRFDEYAKIRLAGSNNRMKADMKKKQTLLQELTAEYNDVLKYKALDWTIAAAYRLGDLYREFAQTLYQAPTPPGLSFEEEDLFLNEIENLGLKFENQAIIAFEQAVMQSRRLKVTNEWADKALEAINKYKPQEYPLFKETKQRPTFTPVYRTDAGQAVAP